MSTAIRSTSSPSRLALPQLLDGRFEDVSVASGIAGCAGAVWPSGLPKLRPGRPRRLSSDQRQAAELPVQNLGGGRFEERARRRPGASRARRRDLGDGSRLPRLRQRRPARPPRHGLAGEGFPLFPQPSADSSRRELSLRGLRRGPGAQRLEQRACRPRQRRFRDLFTANSHVNDAIDRFQSHSYRETNSVSATSATAASRTSRKPGPPRPRQAHRGGVRRPRRRRRIDVVVSALGAPAELWRTSPRRPLAGAAARRHRATATDRRGRDAEQRVRHALAPAVEPRDDGLRLRFRQRRPAAFRLRARDERRAGRSAGRAARSRSWRRCPDQVLTVRESP